jgi:hypothetical protein
VYTAEYEYHALPPEYEGEVELTINNTGVNLNISVSGSGAALTLEFPASLKQRTAAAAYALSVPQRVMEEIGQTIKGTWTITFCPGADGNDEISNADMDGIVSGIVNALKSAGVDKISYKDGVEEKRENKTLGDLLPANFTSGITRDYTGMTLKDDAYTPDAPAVTTKDITLWGDAAVFDKSSTPVTLTIEWTGGLSGDLSAITGMDAGDKAAFITGKAIRVVYSKTGAGSGNDRIRFREITALRQALLAAGALSVAMEPDADNVVSPLFNAEDIFGYPGNEPYREPEHGYGGSLYAYGMAGKVFTEYEDGDKVYGNFTVRKSVGPRPTLPVNCYIDNAGNEKIYVEKLAHLDYASSSVGTFHYIKGLGLQSRFADITFVNTVLGYIQTSANYPAGNRIFFNHPADFVEAFTMLGIDYIANIPPEFSFSGINFYSEGPTLNPVESNLADYPLILRFIEPYLTPEKMAELQKLSFDSNFVLRGDTNPYLGNAIKTEAQGLAAWDGNLAVFLGGKGVFLQELKLTEPTLYVDSEPNPRAGALRNVVLAGNWSNIIIAEAHGVVTSLDTPVKSISNVNNYNLWYRVMGHNSENYTTRIYASVLEVGDITTTDVGKLLAAGTGITLKAKISPDLNRNNAILSTFNTPSNRIYYSGSANGTRPNTTLESYADTVKSGSAPTISLAPTDKSVRPAGARSGSALSTLHSSHFFPLTYPLTLIKAS